MLKHRAAVLLLCLPILGCYEEPVRDHLHIGFAPGPAIVVTAVRSIAPTGASAENPAVEDRVAEARSDLEGGWDRWTRGFSELDAIAERSTIVREHDQTRRGILSALLDSFSPLRRLLGNEGFDASYSDGEIRELQLVPTGGSQATRQQRQLLDDQKAQWADHVAEYLHAATTLYAYLDRAPHRASLCFGYLFDEDEGNLGSLSEEEGELVAAAMEAMELVATALLIENDQAYSLNELSRLVFDSFQGRLTIAVDGPITAIEGFADHQTFVERPPVDLWRALESLVGVWLAPDIVTSLVTPGPDAIQPDPDPVSFASLPRYWAPAPDAWEVESELESRLQPEETYRVTWRTRPAPDDEDEIYSLALEMLAMAEQDLPN